MKLCTLPFENATLSCLYTQCIIWACLLKIRTIGIILSLTRTNIINVGLDFNLNLFAKRLPICHIPLNNNIPTIKICACFRWILCTNFSCKLRFIYRTLIQNSKNKVLDCWLGYSYSLKRLHPAVRLKYNKDCMILNEL